MKRTRQLVNSTTAVSTVISSRAAGLTLALVLLAGAAHAQDNSAVEDLEKRVEEQRIALEEAIANREETADKAKAVEEALDESEQRRLEVEEELRALCEEQESLTEGTYDECMTSIDS